MKEKMKAFVSKYPKKYWYMILTVVALVVVAILVILIPSQKKAQAPVSVDMNPTKESTLETSSNKPPFWQPIVGWMVTNVSATPDSDPSIPAHGKFSVSFTLSAKNNDIYFTPTCQGLVSDNDTNGANFIIIKDGKRFDDPTLSANSCAIINRGMAELTPNGNYLLKAGSQNPFEMIVAYHPVAHGSYKVRITQIGYGKTDGPSDRIFYIDTETLEKLKTTALEL